MVIIQNSVRCSRFVAASATCAKGLCPSIEHGHPYAGGDADANTLSRGIVIGDRFDNEHCYVLTDTDSIAVKHALRNGSDSHAIRDGHVEPSASVKRGDAYAGCDADTDALCRRVTVAGRFDNKH